MKQKKNEQEVVISSFKDRMEKFRNIINKKAGENVAFNLAEENPSEVTKWIPTGSRLIDRIICRNKVAGIPMGKICELAGVESSGKSYMASQIAANALKEEVDVVYFDSESAVDPEFVAKILSKNGFTIEDLLYVQATSLEFVMETIEDMLSQTDKPILFILDSLANTPTRNSMEGSFDPLSSIAEKARILSVAFQKLTIPLSNHDSTLLIVNQLKTNITSNIAEKLTDPYFTPGGKAPLYAYSLRLWFTPRKGKDSYIRNDMDEKIGSEIKCHIKKSRFGTMGREIDTKILWGGDKISFQEDEMLLDVIKRSPNCTQAGSWTSLHYSDGTEEKFQGGDFVNKMNESEKFKNRVLELLDQVLLK